MLLQVIQQFHDGELHTFLLAILFSGELRLMEKPFHSKCAYL